MNRGEHCLSFIWGVHVDSASLAPLRNVDYRQLWTGQLISVIGDKVNQIALAIMVYSVTGSMLQMGIMLGVTVMPAALLGIVAGVFVDRWDRRITMVVSDILRAGIVLAVPFVAQAGIGWVYALSFAGATVSLLFEPAKRSLIPDLVSKERLRAANSLDMATVAISELVGLAFGGALVAAMGFRMAFFLDSATFLLSAFFIYSIAYRPDLSLFAKNVEKTSQGLIREATLGLRHISESPLLRDLMVVYALAVTAGAATVPICYALALKTFDAGAPGLAALDAAITVGILLGSILVGRTGPERNGIKFLWGLLLFGAAFAAVSLADDIYIAMAVLFVAGVTNMWFLIPATTIFQCTAHDNMRGRVMAASTTVVRVFTVVGMVAAGALTERYGTSTLAAVTGVLVIGAAALGWTRPSLRNA
jgi:MFS family permease